jgi:hypothetical protein
MIPDKIIGSEGVLRTRLDSCLDKNPKEWQNSEFSNRTSAQRVKHFPIWKIWSQNLDAIWTEAAKTCPDKNSKIGDFKI